MRQKTRTVCCGGAFRPESRCDFAANGGVELLVQETAVSEPSGNERNERLRILQRVPERTQSNPLPVAAPHFSRDELHERG